MFSEASYIKLVFGRQHGKSGILSDPRSHTYAWEQCSVVFKGQFSTTKLPHWREISKHTWKQRHREKAARNCLTLDSKHECPDWTWKQTYRLTNCHLLSCKRTRRGMESREYNYPPINFKNCFNNSHNLNGTVGSKWQEKVRTRSHEKDLVWEHQRSASETKQMRPTLLGQGQELCLRR